MQDAVAAQTRPGTLDISLLLPRFFGLALIALGITILFGWWIQSPLLVQLIPGYPALPIFTAVGLALAGGALAARAHHAPRRWPAGLGIAVTAIGALALAQSISGASFMPDRWIDTGWLHDERPNITHIPSATALALILSGIALSAIHLTTRATLALVIPLAAVCVFGIGLTVILAHLSGMDMLLFWQPYAHTAPLAALGLALLGAGLWCRWYTHPRFTSLFRGRNDRRILLTTMIVLVCMMLASALVGLGAMQREARENIKDWLGLSLQYRMDALQDTLRVSTNAASAIATRPGIRRELARLRTTPHDAQAKDFIDRAITSFLDFGFGAIAIRDARDRELVHAGRFALEPLMRVPISAMRGAELIWHDGIMLLRVRRTLSDANGVLGTLITEQPLPVFNRMLESIGGLARSAEMTLCANLNDSTRCFPTRLQTKVFSMARQYQGRPLPMTSALEGQTGVTAAASDARGTSIFAAYGQIPLTGLGMVLSVRADEIYRPMIEQFQRVMWLLGVLALGALVVLWKQLQPLAQALASNETRMRDVTETLRQRDAMLTAIMRNTSDAVYFKDNMGRYLLVNAAGARRLGRTPEEIVGRDDAALWPPDVAQAVSESDRRALQNEHGHSAEEKVPLHGGTRTYLVTKASCHDSDGNRVGMIGIAHDVTERKQAEEVIRALSSTDALTGLRNRAGFAALAGAELVMAHRAGRTSYLFSIEINGSRDVNERFGHQDGERALKETAEILRHTFRESDIVARLEGERFAVLTIDDTIDTQEQLVIRLQRSVEEHNREARRTHPLQLNIGTVRYDATVHATLDALLADANISMYRSKEINRENNKANDRRAIL